MSENTFFNFQHTFAELGEDFYQSIAPQVVEKPELVLFNDELAQQLELGSKDFDKQQVANFLSGKEVPAGSKPLAQAYAGHQFGYFTKLGDGRAHLLGEQKLKDGSYFDIQLKGSGQTAFSRSGDGRATLYAMLREYLISEAMHGLKIATSRSLAVVKTNQKVYRETAHQGAVLTRVMKSLIRVGTFEYANRFLGKEKLKILFDYTLNRHFPNLVNAENKALSFIEAVMDSQIELVVDWMRVGFIHGVMNTDNVSIAGQTFDYGPCAFMNTYDPGTVFSSIDSQGRYAYGNQPSIAHWNVTVLAGTLLSLVDDDKEKAIEKAQHLIDSFGKRFEKAYTDMLCNKIGIQFKSESDKLLVEELLQMMRIFGWDFTNTFNDLRNERLDDKLALERFKTWHTKWKDRIKEEKLDYKSLMLKNNPVIIPRNHLVEEILEKATEGDLESFTHYLMELKSPYELKKPENLMQPPKDGDAGYQTYCGT